MKKQDDNHPVGFDKAPGGGLGFGPYYGPGRFGIERSEVSDMHRRAIAGRDEEEGLDGGLEEIEE